MNRWAAWLGANAAPLLLVHLLLRAVGKSLPPTLLSVFTFLFCAAIVVALQWLLLRNTFQNARGWVLSTLLGIALGFPAGIWVLATAERANPFGESEIVDIAAGMAVAGAVLGILQWRILKKSHQRAGWWIPASVAGFAAGGALCQRIWELLSIFWSRGYLCGLDFPGHYELVLMVMAFFVYGLLTGALWLLLRVPAADRLGSSARQSR